MKSNFCPVLTVKPLFERAGVRSLSIVAALSATLLCSPFVARASAPSNANVPKPAASTVHVATVSPFTDTPLTGLKAIDVVVEDLNDDAKSAGLTQDTITSDVKDQLRQAGIRVISEKDPGYYQQDPSGAYFYVNVNAAKSDTNLYVYSVHVELMEEVRLERPIPVQSYADTWNSGQIGNSDNADFVATVRDNVKELVREFINDYQTQNPKSGGQ